MAVIKHPVPYGYDGGTFEGMLVYDDSVTEQRPAIFMQPDWLGICSHTTGMAAEAAETDFVVLLADMFGKNYGGMHKTNEELGKVARSNRANIDFILGCGKVADETLTAEADRLGLIDISRKGAVGYCMGGGYLLEQIRNGTEFHYGGAPSHSRGPAPVRGSAGTPAPPQQPQQPRRSCNSHQ